jgi:HAD superfamily hydrolase (TIGR01490 family)
MKIKDRAAFFDIDETLVKGQTQKFLALIAFKEGKIGLLKLLSLLFFFARYKLGLVKDIREIMEASYAIVKGWPVTEANRLIKKSFEYGIKQKIFPEGEKLIKKLKKEGYRIILVSNTLQQIVDLLVDYFDAEAGIGTTLAEKNGVLEGKIGRLVYGQNKVKYLQEFYGNQIDFKKSAAYTDNKSDLPLLELVGRPVVVNPDLTLKSEAAKRNWQVINFDLT